MPYDDPDPARLGDLLHAVFRRLRRRWAEQLAPFGLTPHQFRALDALAGRTGAQGHGPAESGRHGGGAGSLRVKDLAEALRIAPRSATEVVDLLERQELVERVPDPCDRRATLVALTARGAALREKVRKDRRRESEEYFSRLEPGDRVELERLLRLLTTDGPHRSPQATGPVAGDRTTEASGRARTRRQPAPPPHVKEP